MQRLVRPAAAAISLIGLGAAAWAWGGALMAFFRDQSQVQAWMASWGAWGPLASIGLNVAQVIAAPIPGQAINIANGYLFGLGPGTLYSLIGVSLGSFIAMSLARRWGRTLVARLIEPGQMARLDAWAERRGPLFFLMVFLLPFVPDDLACFAIGLSHLSIPRMTVLALLARLPGILGSVWLGAYATALSPAGWAVLIAGSAGLAWGAWRWMRTSDRPARA